jgi:DNA-binding response OmpR family regulator
MKNLKSLIILYIDDETLIRENAIEYLSFYCNNVYGAIDGISGFEAYEEFKPDIIISDIRMPKLNGIEMVKKIRQNDKKTKIILATAFLETSYLLEAIELGLIKYLIKPITVDKLLPVLESCIEDIIEDKSIFYLNNEFTFDILNKTLFFKNEQITLTKKELLFLEFLIKNYKRTVKYSEFNNYVWNGEMTEDSMRSIVKDIRKKISKNIIKNVSGIGYQINV